MLNSEIQRLDNTVSFRIKIDELEKEYKKMLLNEKNLDNLNDDIEDLKNQRDELTSDKISCPKKSRVWGKENAKCESARIKVDGILNILKDKKDEKDITTILDSDFIKTKDELKVEEKKKKIEEKKKEKQSGGNINNLKDIVNKPDNKKFSDKLKGYIKFKLLEILIEIKEKTIQKKKILKQMIHFLMLLLKNLTIKILWKN